MPEAYGPYRRLEALGEGGAARVFRGRREAPYVQDVALKVHPERAAADAEHRALAGLDHPGCVRLLDRIEHEDQSVLVLELVRGARPLDVAAADADDDQRLAWFVALCDAVAHAHARLVVHGDLKPANVLVDEHGSIRLVDFGDQGHTRAWAAPEVLWGEPAGVPADIYALGRILEDLVAVPKRDLARVIDGCLGAVPQARYATVTELRDDAQRIREHRPVQARPASLGWRLRLWARRHPRAAATAALAALTWIAGVGALASQIAALTEARDAARVEEVRVERTLTSLVELLESTDPALGPAGDPEAVARFLGAVDARLMAEVPVDAPARPRVAQALGEVLAARSMHDRALARLSEAWELYAARSPGGPEVAAAALAYGEALVQAGDPAARPVLERALSDHLRLFGDRDARTAAAHRRLALAHPPGDPDRREHCARAVAILREIPDASLDLADALVDLGTVHYEELRYADAAAAHEEALERTRAHLGPDHPDALIVKSNLALIYGRLEAHERQIAMLAEVLEATERIYGRVHDRTAQARLSLVITQANRGDHQAGIVGIQQAIDVLVELHGDDHPQVARSRRWLAWLLYLERRYAESSTLLRDALATYERVQGPGARITEEVRCQLGLSELLVGRPAEALALTGHALDQLTRDAPTGGHGAVAVCQQRRARALLATGRRSEASRLAEAAVAYYAVRNAQSGRTAPAAECIAALAMDPVVGARRIRPHLGAMRSEAMIDPALRDRCEALALR